MRYYLLFYFLFFSSIVISQTNGFAVELNSFTVLDSEGELFLIENESNILGDSNSSTKIFSPSISYFLNNKKLLFRFGYSSRKTGVSGTSYNADGSYRETMMFSKSKSYQLGVGLYNSFILEDKLLFNIYTSAFAGVRIFRGNTFEVTFFDSQDQVIGLNGLGLTSPPIYRFGFEIGSSFFYRLNSKIEIGCDIKIPIFVLLQKGLTTSINFREDQNERLVELEIAKVGRDLIIAKEIIFSPSIKYNF